MTKKLILAAGIIILFSAGKSVAQSWNLAGNSGTTPSTQFIGTTDGKDFRIRTNNVVRAVFRPNGNVGIGTSVPTVKLEVIGTVKFNELLVGTTTGAAGYIASIGGKLIAEEVRVDLKAVWPDYVFSEGHVLMPLGELEQWLNTNKHLPGIPAASEMKNNGILLGDMQAKSMEKIEEAMLYILQLNKENHQLKAQIGNLQKQVDGLTLRFSEGVNDNHSGKK